MRYLGIDYGTKRVGLALSDESGRVAFPHAILDNRGEVELVEKIAKICAEKKVTGIVLGESLNYKQEDNPVMTEINKFKTALAQAVNLEIKLEPEWLTSALASRSNNTGEKSDDRAAALILQTYLDRADKL